MTQTDRQRELTQLSRALQSGNYNGHTIERFKQLVKEEVTPQIEAAMPRIIAERQRREAAREAARRAGQQAGVAAGRRFMERLQREREREAADAWRRIVERRGR